MTFYTEFVGVGSFEVELMFFGGCAFWYFQAWVLSLYVAAITVCEWGWRRSLLLRLFWLLETDSFRIIVNVVKLVGHRFF